MCTGPLVHMCPHIALGQATHISAVCHVLLRTALTWCDRPLRDTMHRSLYHILFVHGCFEPQLWASHVWYKDPEFFFREGLRSSDFDLHAVQCDSEMVDLTIR